MSNTDTIPNLIHGQWQNSAETKTTPVHNPSRGKIIAQVPESSSEELEQAVISAQKAFPSWAATPPNERAQVFFRMKNLLEEQFEDIAQGISIEHGKTLIEARGDIRRGLEVIEFACSAPTLLMGENLINIARGIDCTTEKHPLGIVAGICPFNFPALVPMWMFPLAIVSGNCFILKPSEKVPLTMQKIAQIALDSGLPPGVLNIIHGGRNMVDSILEHPAISAVSFVGSTPIAKYIYQKGCQHGKRVQAAGGAKNFALIMPDANPTKTAEAIKDGAFGCAGERCMASSTAVIVGDASDTILPDIRTAIEQVSIGPTDVPQEQQPNMGALITKEHCQRVTDIITEGEKNGAQITIDGRSAKVKNAQEGFYHGATLIENMTYENPIAEVEIFGPTLSVFKAKNLNEAILLANRQSFGNGASIFTTSGTAAREFRNNVSAGMIGVNVAVPAPLAYFPFTGWNDSFYGDLHIQGKEGIAFFTKQKTTTTRWFSEGEGDIWHKE